MVVHCPVNHLQEGSVARGFGYKGFQLHGGSFTRRFSYRGSGGCGSITRTPFFIGYVSL